MPEKSANIRDFIPEVDPDSVYIPTSVLHNPQLSCGARLLYGFLFTEERTPSNEQMIELLGSKYTFERCTKELREAGLLGIEKVTNKGRFAGTRWIIIHPMKVQEHG